MDLDTSNKFAVGVASDNVLIITLQKRFITKDEAINLAAWLICLADPYMEQVKPLVEACLNT